MISAAVCLLLSGMMYGLRLSGGTFPKPLSEEEERKYLELASQGNIEARNVLIERNMRLVAHVMKKYYSQTDDQEDLLSIGTMGLIKGISTFDPSKGAKLATYAARCVENEILMQFRRQKKRAGDVSLSECIETGKDGTALSLMDVICTEDDPYEDFANRELCGTLRNVMEKVLTKREKKVIYLRYGMEQKPPMTQKEVADLCGISRSYVSRIEKKALKKLEKALNDEPCGD